MPRLAIKQGRPSTAILSARIRAERERLGVGEREAARKLGVSQASYRQMERSCTVQYGVLLALVRDVGMDPQALAPELFSPPPADPARSIPARA
jgi:transcriptional regulator with XRE-family HTH domain